MMPAISALSSANAGMPAGDPALMKRSRSRSVTALRNLPLRRLTPPIASPCAPWQVTHLRRVQRRAVRDVRVGILAVVQRGLGLSKAAARPIPHHRTSTTVAETLRMDRLPWMAAGRLGRSRHTIRHAGWSVNLRQAQCVVLPEALPLPASANWVGGSLLGVPAIDHCDAGRSVTGLADAPGNAALAPPAASPLKRAVHSSG